jgi:hypothetical protein
LTSQLLRDPQSHAMQPRADAAIQLQGMGPSSEDEEDRLEGVVGIVSIAENSQACSIHEGAMSADQSRKRIFVAFGQKSGEKTRIQITLVRSRPAIKYLCQSYFRHRLTRLQSTCLALFISICPQIAKRSSKNGPNNGISIVP